MKPQNKTRKRRLLKVWSQFSPYHKTFLKSPSVLNASTGVYTIYKSDNPIKCALWKGKSPKGNSTFQAFGDHNWSTS